MNSPLKYLFTATFADGSVIRQTPEDRSVIDPEKRSQFYDVMQQSEERALVAFALSGGGHEYVVNLIDGHFEVDGVPFKIHSEPLSDFRIIFFRDHTHNIAIGATVSKELNHTVSYRLGWQCTVNNVNHQRVMTIA